MKRSVGAYSIFSGIGIGSILIFAQTTVADTMLESELDRFSRLLSDINTIVSILTIIAVAAAFLFFFWGLAKFLLDVGGKEGSDTIKSGKQKMIWGVVAIFVLTSLWGVIYFLELFFLGGNQGRANIEIFRLPVGTKTEEKATDGTHLIQPEVLIRIIDPEDLGNAPSGQPEDTNSKEEKDTDSRKIDDTDSRKIEDIQSELQEIDAKSRLLDEAESKQLLSSQEIERQRNDLEARRRELEDIYSRKLKDNDSRKIEDIQSELQEIDAKSRLLDEAESKQLLSAQEIKRQRNDLEARRREVEKQQEAVLEIQKTRAIDAQYKALVSDPSAEVVELPPSTVFIDRTKLIFSDPKTSKIVDFRDRKIYNFSDPDNLTYSSFEAGVLELDISAKQVTNTETKEILIDYSGEDLDYRDINIEKIKDQLERQRGLQQQLIPGGGVQ